MFIVRSFDEVNSENKVSSEQNNHEKLPSMLSDCRTVVLTVMKHVADKVGLIARMNTLPYKLKEVEGMINTLHNKANK